MIIFKQDRILARIKSEQGDSIMSENTVKNTVVAITGIKDSFIEELVNIGKNETKTSKIDVIMPTGEKICNAYDANINGVIICGSEKSVLNLIECQKLIKLSSYMDVKILPYSSETGLLFMLGTLMNKDTNYIISEESKKLFAPLLDTALANEFKIFIAADGKNGGDNKNKAKTTRKRRKKIVIMESGTADISLNANPDAKTNVNSAENINPVAEDHKTFMNEPEVTDSEKSQTDDADNSVSLNESVDVNIDIAADKSNENTENTTSETSEKYSQETINEFLKRSGIRASEMNFNGDNNKLASDIMDILAVCYTKNEVREILETQFNASDVDYLMLWMEHNLVKLHEISCKKK